jgi:hypothetical protein
MVSILGTHVYNTMLVYTLIKHKIHLVLKQGVFLLNVVYMYKLVKVVFFLKNFSLLLYIFAFISLLPLYKYLFKLVRGTILLLVLEHAVLVHTFFAINLDKYICIYTNTHT